MTLSDHRLDEQHAEQVQAEVASCSTLAQSNHLRGQVWTTPESRQLTQ